MQLVCPSCGAKNRVPDARLHDAPVCGRCSSALMSTEPVALDDTAFNSFLNGTELPVLVDFWAPWCGPCRQMAPHFVAAAQRVPDVRFVKVNTDAAPSAAMRHQIRSIPTMVLFHRGREVARLSGALSAGDLVAWLQRHVERAATV